MRTVFRIFLRFASCQAGVNREAAMLSGLPAYPPALRTVFRCPFGRSMRRAGFVSIRLHHQPRAFAQRQWHPRLPPGLAQLGSSSYPRCFFRRSVARRMPASLHPVDLPAFAGQISWARLLRPESSSLFHLSVCWNVTSVPSLAKLPWCRLRKSPP